MRKLLAGIFVFGLFIFVNDAKAETILSGGSTISTPTIWTLAGSPYTVRGTGYVTVSSLLTIEPGVVVRFEPRRSTKRTNGIRVIAGGRLTALGSSALPIIFTSAMPDPLPGDWRGIRCEGECRVSFAVVRWGGNIRDSFANFDVRGNSVVEIHDSVIGDSGWNGVWIEGDAAPVFERVSIENNNGPAIDASRATGSAMLRDALVQGNLGALRLSVENTLEIQNTQFVGNIPQTAELLGDTISRNARWPNLAGISYLAPNVGKIFVRDGATLTIDPGARVQFPRRAGLYVEGSLVANGTQNEPIVFTSAQPFPLPGDWGGIYFDNGAGSLSHIMLQYGGLFQDDFSGASYGFTSRNVVTVENSAVSISDTMIHDNLDTAVYSFGASSLALNSSTIHHTPRGLFVHANSSLMIRGNSFASTTEYALYSAGPAQVDAINNWWGSASGPAAVGNPGGQGEKIFGNVLYDPWIGKRAAHEPVILIPGILGTELRRGDEILWLDLGRTFTDRGDEFMDALALNPDGSPSDGNVVVGDVIRSIDILPRLSFVYFGDLISELQRRGYEENTDLFFFPYDWRLDIRTNSDKLNLEVERIIAQTGTGKVNLVAHSMGGIITKQYMVANGADRVDSVVFLGTPHLGSPKAAKALLFGDNLDIPFLSSEEIKNIGHNMFSLYHLLPSARYFSIVGHYFDDLARPFVPDYSETMAFLASHGLNNGHLDNAAALHADNLDDFHAPGADIYNISGCREPSIGRIIRRNDGAEDEYYVEMTAGDGTVTLGSSDAIDVPADHRFYLKDTTHSKMPSENGVRQLVADIISGSLDSQHLPANVTQDGSVCRIRGRVVSVHSPVELHAYDNAGNHVGPSASGTIDYDIPGAEYEDVANNKFIFLPEGADYTIVLDATATGTFSFRIADVEDGEITQTVYYNDILIVPSSEGQIILSANGTNSDLVLDANTIPPSAILTNEESQDFTKPSTTMAIVGTEGANGWYRSAVKVSLSATDDNSGVLKIEYSLDNGKTWQIFASNIRILEEGETKILYRSVDRAGNKEQIQENIIRIDTVAPEANIAFDIPVEDFVIRGVDANSTTVFATETGALVADIAGNVLELEIEKQQNEQMVQLRITGVSYNGVSAEIPKNQSVVHWSFDKDGELKHFEQMVNVHNDFHIVSMYNGHKDGAVFISLNEENGQRKEKSDRLVLITLQTNVGELNYQF